MENTQEMGIGWLYVVTHANARGMVKIGITDRPTARMNELDRPEILARVPVAQPRRHERRLHHLFGGQRLPQSEWFNLSEEQLAELFKEVAELAEPFLDLVVLPGGGAEKPEPEPCHEVEETPVGCLPRIPKRVYVGRAPHPDRCGDREVGSWRAEMLSDYELD